MRPHSTLWLFALVYSSIGFTIYFALGVVADRGLGATPVIFLITGLLFLFTMLTYGEGASMFRERGGSSTFARYAFNELVAFIAGWAILIDYLIVIALAAISAAAYLAPIPFLPGHGWSEVAITLAIVGAVTVLNIRGVSGRSRPLALAGLAIADVALQVLLVVIGLFVVWQPEALTAQLDLFADPSFADLINAAVVAMLAYAGIEVAANFAPDTVVSRRALRRVIWSGAITLPITYAGMAFVALMAVPVVASPAGPTTELATTHLEAPFLGVVAAFDPAWLATATRWLVVAVAVPTLIWAANISMLGVSRHIYALAVNRQIPSWLGRLGTGHETPYVAILISAVIVAGLTIPRDVDLLAQVYAIGATLAVSIAHLSILRLRRTDPDRIRPFRVPWNIGARGGLPVPALAGAVLSVAAFVSVLIYHDVARWVGGAWMIFGLVGYVVYRVGVERTSLTQRVTVLAGDLTKSVPDLAYRTILVPVFGTELDDDIVGTAGRLAEAGTDGTGRDRDIPAAPRLDLVYVVEIPLTRSLEAPLPERETAAGNSTLERALEVAAEYPEADVTARVLRARSVGAGIVAAAREDPVEMIVIGGELPSRVRGGALMGGAPGRPPEIGPATEYVMRRAPCRVLVTAPPAGLESGPNPPGTTGSGPDPGGGADPSAAGP